MEYWNVVYCSVLQPVKQWDTTNVIEWMATVNLYRYSQIFRRYNVNGESLVELNTEKLKVFQLLIVLCGFSVD